MKIIDIDSESRKIVVGRSQLTDKNIVLYGDDNIYPTHITSLIENSQTAKASCQILSRFVASSFVDENIGKTEVGKTFTGRAYTLNQLTNDIAKDIARFGGAFVMLKKDFENRVIDCKIMRYEDCRFSKFDGNMFSNFVYYGDFSHTIKQEGFSYDIKKAKKYAVFTDKQSVFELQSKATKTTTQVYHIFADDTYIYPLSPFDAVAYDMSSEYHIARNRNYELTTGLPHKTLIHMSFDGMSEEERKEQIKTLRDWGNTNGSRFGIIESEMNTDGTLADTYKIDTIEDKRGVDMFLNAEKSTANNIRKAAYGLPAVLIDYESGNLSNNSGEQIKTAYDYYARMTQDLRTLVSESLGEIFENTTIPFVNKDFTLKTPTI